jgi:hypothetical protein
MDDNGALIDNPLVSDVKPSVTPSDAEIAAWQSLPREEQLRRMRGLVSSAEATQTVRESTADILVEARRRAGVVRG